MEHNTTNMPSWEGVQGGKYFLVQNMDQFREFFQEAKRQRKLVIDTETTGLSWVNDEACGIVVGWGASNNYYLPIAHMTGEEQLDLEEIRPFIKELFEDPTVQKYFWHEKFDRHFLRKAGIETRGLRHDGMIQFHLLDENSLKGLKDRAKKSIHPKADAWEKAVKQWLKNEAKRRRKEFGVLVKEQVALHRAELDAQLQNSMPLPEYDSLTKSQVTARLKKIVREEILHEHPLAKNKLADITYADVPLEIMAPYAAADTHYTFVLVTKQLPVVAQHPDLSTLYVNEMSLSDLLFEVEQNGIKVDHKFLKELIPKLEQEIHDLEQSIYTDIGYVFNIESNQQLVKALKSAGCRLTKLTKKGKDIANEGGDLEDKHFATDRETMEKLAVKYEFANKILQLRKARKSLSTYVLRLIELSDDKHYVHSTFNANVSTGRMSSKDPNVQNQDSRSGIREAFTVPEPIDERELALWDPDKNEWVFVFIDYSQVELRLTAHHSQDPTFLAAYPHDGEDIDLHSLTCAEAVMRRTYEEVVAIKEDKNHPEHSEVSWFRNIAKRVGFGIIYGAGAGAIQNQVSTPTRHVTFEECEQYIEAYFERYPGVKRWIDETCYALGKTGYLQNTFGRYRRLPDVFSKERWKRERTQRQGVNFLIQGDAADLFKHAAVRVGKFLRKNNAKTKIVNFVHDDIQFYWHKSELDMIPEVKAIMEDFPQFSVPIVADVEWSPRDWKNKKSWAPGVIKEHYAIT